MFRFSIKDDNWIVRFSPNLNLEYQHKQAILNSIFQLDKELVNFAHGDAFAIFNDEIGLIIFNVEKIPSLILTISNIISKDNWYKQRDLKIIPYT